MSGSGQQRAREHHSWLKAREVTEIFRKCKTQCSSGGKYNPVDRLIECLLFANREPTSAELEHFLRRSNQPETFPKRDVLARRPQPGFNNPRRNNSHRPQQERTRQGTRLLAILVLLPKPPQPQNTRRQRH